jgi:hypothetical protein
METPKRNCSSHPVIVAFLVWIASRCVDEDPPQPSQQTRVSTNIMCIMLEQSNSSCGQHLDESDFACASTYVLAIFIS